MTESSDAYARYLEAVGALQVVEQRRRAALKRVDDEERRALDDAAAQEKRARRIETTVGTDMETEARAVAELGARMGVSIDRPGSDDAVPAVRSVADLRADLGEVRRWREQTGPLVESLQRTRARLAAAESAPAPAPPRERPALGRRGPRPVVLAVAGAVLVAVLIAVVIALTI